MAAILGPSLALIYAMDEVVDPSLTIKAIGHQWYWCYEYDDFELIDYVHDDPIKAPVAV